MQLHVPTSKSSFGKMRSLIELKYNTSGDAVEGVVGGQLLLRLSRGFGSMEDRGWGNVEPDEDIHVPRMALLEIDEDGSPYLEAGELEVGHYAQIDPVPGELILFPGWLSHAVAPHAGNTDRVSVSFNWVPPVPK